VPTIRPDLHGNRQAAESFGADAARYDRTRPHYPDALVQRIMAASPGPDVLDVGCGTGIAARQFQAAGATVLGVDVDARMADFARHGGLEVEVATFGSWDPAGRSFDAVIAGQTWHWVDPVAGAAKAAQVLRPGGRLALFWNVFQPSADLAEAFAAVYSRVLPELPAFRPGAEAYSPIVTKVADGIRDVGAFDAPEQWRFDWERTYTRDEWLDQLPTSGFHNQLSPDEADELMAGIGAAVDGVGGSFVMPYTAVVVTAALRPRRYAEIIAPVHSRPDLAD
jgi:SAM-dependent methyltransferase